jgi:hypothetical protein
LMVCWARRERGQKDLGMSFSICLFSLIGSEWGVNL